MNLFALKFYVKKTFKFFQENFLFIILFLAFFYYLGKETYFYFRPQKDLPQPVTSQEEVLSASAYEEKMEESLVVEETVQEGKSQCVFILGAVQNSGRYEFEKGSTLEILLEKSGGLQEEGLREFLNLSRPLQNNEVFYFPSLEDIEKAWTKLEKAQSPWWWKKELYLFFEEVEEKSVSKKKTSDEGCDLPRNIFKFEQLKDHVDELPLTEKVKDSLKQHLKEHMLKSPDDLLEVKGIGEKTLIKLLPYFVFEFEK